MTGRSNLSLCKRPKGFYVHWCIDFLQKRNTQIICSIPLYVNMYLQSFILGIFGWNLSQKTILDQHFISEFLLCFWLDNTTQGCFLISSRLNWSACSEWGLFQLTNITSPVSLSLNSNCTPYMRLRAAHNLSNIRWFLCENIDSPGSQWLKVYPIKNLGRRELEVCRILGFVA